MEFPMISRSESVSHQITIKVVPYKGSNKELEADVHMITADGQDIRRRWKSPHTSVQTTERWARTKASGFLTKQTREAREPATTPTFAEFAERSMHEHAAANRLRPSTVSGQQSIYKEHLLPRFGGLRLDQITEEHVTQIKLLSHLKASTVNSILQLLGQILRSAVDKQVLARMPKIKRVKANEGRHDYYSPDEYERLVDAATTIDPRALIVILLTGDAGLRIGEVMALDWGRVDFAANKVHVEVAVWTSANDRIEHVGPPKSGKPRSIDMSPRLRQALADFMGPTPPARSVRVLTRDEGRYGKAGDPVTRAVVREWVEAAQTQAGIDVKGIHTLRHTFCSHLAMAGVPVTAIRDLAGHSSVKITNGYMHLAPDVGVSAISVLSSFHGAATARLEKARRRDPAPEKN
jgi:integrase